MSLPRQSLALKQALQVWPTGITPPEPAPLLVPLAAAALIPDAPSVVPVPAVVEPVLLARPLLVPEAEVPAAVRLLLAGAAQSPAWQVNPGQQPSAPQSSPATEHASQLPFPQAKPEQQSELWAQVAASAPQAEVEVVPAAPGPAAEQPHSAMQVPTSIVEMRRMSFEPLTLVNCAPVSWIANISRLWPDLCRPRSPKVAEERPSPMVHVRLDDHSPLAPEQLCDTQIGDAGELSPVFEDRPFAVRGDGDGLIAQANQSIEAVGPPGAQGGLAGDAAQGLGLPLAQLGAVVDGLVRIQAQQPVEVARVEGVDPALRQPPGGSQHSQHELADVRGRCRQRL